MNIGWHGGDNVVDISAILAAALGDPPENGRGAYRLVTSDAPWQVMAQVVAAWRSGQIAVLASDPKAVVGILPEGSAVTLPEDFPYPSTRSDIAFSDMDWAKPADAAHALVLSSGSTGAPKGILLSRAGLAWASELLPETFGMTHAECYGNLSALHSIGGLRAFLLSWRFGIPSRFVASRPNAGLALIREVLDGEMDVILSGSSFVRLLAAGRRAAGPPRRLRAIMSCGSVFDDHAAALVRDHYGIEVVHSYGQTETSGIVLSERPGTYRPGYMPPPLPGVEVSLRPSADPSVSEIGVRAPHPFLGYVGDPPRDRRAVIWTGDLVHPEADGMRFAGRVNHAAKSLDGARFIFPDRVEAWLRDQMKFEDAAVRPVEGREGLWGVVAAPALPDDLLSRMVAALGPEYGSVDLVAGTVTRNAAGKLVSMDPR